MKNQSHRLIPSTLACVFLLISACSKKSTDSHAGHDHEHHGHGHTAPHGGVLVEVGDHQYNLELVLDRATGTLTTYTLDAHAENFLRTALPHLDLVITTATATQPTALRLLATANSASGETLGDTSQFTVTAEILKTQGAFTVTVPALVLRTHTFNNLSVELPAAK